MARALGLGLLIGFLIAASPGPIFFLVLRRTLARGWNSGLISGLGVATGDAIYAALAAFGVAVVSNFLIGQRRWIGLVGGGALILIGLRTLVGRQTRHPDPPPQGRREMRKDGRRAGAAGLTLELGRDNGALDQFSPAKHLSLCRYPNRPIGQEVLEVVDALHLVVGQAGQHVLFLETGLLSRTIRVEVGDAYPALL